MRRYQAGLFIKELPLTVIGLDFSAAKDAGRKAWVCWADLRCGKLIVKRLFPLKTISGGCLEPSHCCSAFVDYFLAAGNCAGGFDFSFSLPESLIDAGLDWKSFIRKFSEKYDTPESFREDCLIQANEQELKRNCDVAARVPFSAYNLRIYRQTFYGIRDILKPLTDAGVNIVPLTTCESTPPFVMETCPASVLKSENIYMPYKGLGSAFMNQRKAILKWITGQDVIISSECEFFALNNYSGDALDALITAVCVARVIKRGGLSPDNPKASVEGWVYY